MKFSSLPLPRAAAKVSSAAAAPLVGYSFFFFLSHQFLFNFLPSFSADVHGLDGGLVMGNAAYSVTMG